MRRVVLESPYSGDVTRNVRYARLCADDCRKQGEAPLAGHLLYTQFLDDTDPEQRAAGIAMHLSWIEVCDAVVVYGDLGITDGMREGIKTARLNFKPIKYRSLGEPWARGLVAPEGRREP